MTLWKYGFTRSVRVSPDTAGSAARLANSSTDADAGDLYDDSRTVSDTDDEFADLDSDAGEYQGDDFLELTDLARLVEDKSYAYLTIKHEKWSVTAELKVLFEERSNLNSIAACSPLTFAPGMDAVFTALDPPHIAFFTWLPQTATGTVWGVYVIVLLKRGCLPKLYIGSGTNVTGGVALRLKNYCPGSELLPRFVRQAFEDGYTVVHKGLLCWAPVPVPGLVPRVRARFLCIETMFTLVFHATFPASIDCLHKDLGLWDWFRVTWEPLCSHLPLTEAITGDVSLSPEEVETVAAARRERARVLRRISMRKSRSKDIEATWEKWRVWEKAYYEKNHNRISECRRKVREEAVNSGQFRYNVCNVNLTSQQTLDTHLASEVHAKRVASIPPRQSVARRAQMRRLSAKHIAQGDYHCDTCNKSVASNRSLKLHRNTKSHIAKAANQSETAP